MKAGIYQSLHILAGTLFLTACAPTAMAWNPAGHMMIASIAYDELSPSQRSWYVSLLREHPRFRQDFLDALPEGLDTQQQARWIFMRAAVWPDLARSFTGHDKAYNHPFWHFIDIPVFLDEQAKEKIHPPALEFAYHKISSDNAMNVVAALNQALDQLKNPDLPASQRAIALCWVLHLGGDIHQPLHGATLYSVARFREIPIGDKGGNSVPVQVSDGDLCGKVSNLHALWDSMLATDDSFESVIMIAHQLADQYRKEALGQMNPAVWAQESHQLAVTSVYTSAIRSTIEAGEAHPHAPLPPFEIDSEYLAAARTVAKQRAALAGYRTGALLGLAHSR